MSDLHSNSMEFYENFVKFHCDELFISIQCFCHCFYIIKEILMSKLHQNIARCMSGELCTVKLFRSLLVTICKYYFGT